MWSFYAHTVAVRASQLSNRSNCYSMYICMYGHHTSRSMDQPGKVANLARGQLNRENNIPLSPCVPENLVSRDGFSRPVPRPPAHLHTQAESGAYLRDSSRVPRRRPFMKPPYAIGSVPSLSGHAIYSTHLSIPKKFFLMISLQRANKKNDHGNSHLANILHTPRTYLTCASNPINNKTSTMRGHEKYNTILYNTGTAIRTAKRGFLSTYVQSGLTADNTQAAQRRSDAAT